MQKGFNLLKDLYCSTKLEMVNKEQYKLMAMNLYCVFHHSLNIVTSAIQHTRFGVGVRSARSISVRERYMFNIPPQRKLGSVRS